MAGFLLGPTLARRFSHVKAIVVTELLSIPFFLILALADRLWLAVAAFWFRGALMNMNRWVSTCWPPACSGSIFGAMRDVGRSLRNRRRKKRRIPTFGEDRPPFVIAPTPPDLQVSRRIPFHAETEASDQRDGGGVPGLNVRFKTMQLHSSERRGDHKA
jgi:hypothetical protein